MMTIAVFLPASPTAAAWRLAFQPYLDGHAGTGGEGASPVTVDVRVEVTEDLLTFENAPADRRYILWPGTETFCSVLVVEEDPTFGRTVLLSRALARVSEIAVRGAVVLDARALSVTIDGIGELSRAPSLTARAQERDRGPESVLAIYRNIPPSVGDSATWPLDLFFDLGGSLKTVDIDLTGRDRYLVYGPYIDLPTGEWGVTLSFRFEGENLAEPTILIEWGAGEDYVGQEFTLKRSGFYRVEIQRPWTAVQPAQLRVRLLRPVFHGLLTDISVVAERLASR